MRNLLFEKVDYRERRTTLGVWRTHLTERGDYFAEFRSHRELLGLPWLHYTRGRDPATGRRRTARGVIAIGRLAVGGLAIGQAAAGIIGIGQASFGLLFGFGQATLGLYALGQLAIGWEFAVGQVAVAHDAIGQLAVGEYALGQLAMGDYIWSPEEQDPDAVAHFKSLWEGIREGWLAR